MAAARCKYSAKSQGAATPDHLSTNPGRTKVSLAIDASAAVALHFADEREPFVPLENRLADGEEAFTAPNFFQEVMEALRRAVREGRTTSEDVQVWLGVLDSYNIAPMNLNPLAGCATWLISETINVSAYDAGYIAIAKTKGLPLWSRDAALANKAPRVAVRVLPERRLVSTL
jgi:predicted nucleic acid-binding protein